MSNSEGRDRKHILVEGQIFSIPRVFKPNQKESKYVLYEINQKLNFNIADLSSMVKLTDDSLEIDGLKEGSYMLHNLWSNS